MAGLSATGPSTLSTSVQRVFGGDCAVYEYKYAGPGSNYHPANDVQAVFVGELTITREQYELTVKKVDSTNPSKGLSGARFLIQSANGTYSKEVVTGSDGTYTLSPLDAGTYSVTEMALRRATKLITQDLSMLFSPQRERYHRHGYLY